MSAGKTVWRGFQLIVVLAVLWYAGRNIDWQAVGAEWQSTSINFPLVLVSSAIMLCTYLLLVDMWRRVVRAWGGSLDFKDAARIWFISNIMKWIPGRVFQITTMGAMAQVAGVSPVAAVGSSLLMALLNVLAGFAVILVTATHGIDIQARWLYFAAAAVVGLLLSPSLIPAIARKAGTLFGRKLVWPMIPHATLVIAFLGNVATWLLYGLAFHILCNALYPANGGALTDHIAVYTASYLAGYLFVPAPGGLGVREVALKVLLLKLQLASPSEAAVIVVLSRVWLTALELLPGVLLFFIFKPSPSTTPAPLPHDGP